MWASLGCQESWMYLAGLRSCMAARHGACEGTVSVIDGAGDWPMFAVMHGAGRNL